VVLAQTGRAEELLALSRLVEEELNVKEVKLEAHAEHYVQFEVVPNFKSVGPRFGKLAPKIRGELAKRDGAELRNELRASGKIAVTVDGQSLELRPEDVELRVRAKEGFAADDDAQAVVALDTRITPELRAECLRQEVVVAIQNARKELNLKYEQRIRTTVAGSPDVIDAVKADPDYVKGQTLSEALSVAALAGAAAETIEVKVEAVK